MAAPSARAPADLEPKDPAALAVKRIAEERARRRESAEGRKNQRNLELAKNEGLGDLDFGRMIAQFRATAPEPRKHDAPGDHDICCVVRKRPINSREQKMKDWDCVTCVNPRVVVHAPKLKVDGITKYLDNMTFEFDHVFDDSESSETVYHHTAMPLVAYMFQKKGHGTVFAYGQTGSGKTFTMSCITECVARDVFRALENREFRGKGFSVHVSFLEIYGARCTDLLHDRNKVLIREDAKQRVVASGLAYVRCEDAASCLDAIKRGAAERTTFSTEVNQASSRSHSICEIVLRGSDGRVHGSISLIDLAGSERAADSRNHNRQRRIESAEINKSLLALKECIRALARRDVEGAEGHVHVPYRASKLTMVLKESFESENARVVMIATVSPNASSADHSQNTLRYADRVKEKSLTTDADESASDDGDDDGEDAAVRKAKLDATFSILRGSVTAQGARAGRGGAAGVTGIAEEADGFGDDDDDGGEDEEEGGYDAPTTEDDGARRRQLQQQRYPPAAAAAAAPTGPVRRAAAAAAAPFDAAPRVSPVTVPPEQQQAVVRVSRRAVAVAVDAGGGAGRSAAASGAAGGPPVSRVLPRQPFSVDAHDESKAGDDCLDSISRRRGVGGAASSAYDPPAAPDAGGSGLALPRQAAAVRSAASAVIQNGPIVRAHSQASGLTAAAAAAPSGAEPATPGGSGIAMDGRAGSAAGGFRRLMRVVSSGGLPVAAAAGDAASGAKPAAAAAAGAAARPVPAGRRAAAAAAASAAQSDQQQQPPHSARTSPLTVPPTLASPRKLQGAGGLKAALSPGGGGLPSPGSSRAPAPAAQKRAPQRVPAAAAAQQQQQLRPSASDADDEDEDAGGLPVSGHLDEKAGRRRMFNSFAPLPQPQAATGAGVNAADGSDTGSPPQPAGAKRHHRHHRPAGGSSIGSGGAGAPSSPQRDLEILHRSLRHDKSLSAAAAGRAGAGGGGAAGASSWAAAAEELDLKLQSTVTKMVEEEDDILREHMESIQVNANLLTQEGALLARVQGKGVVDYDIDAYAGRLAEILQRKLDVTASLLERLRVFREHLAEEEELSKMRAEAEERQMRHAAKP